MGTFYRINVTVRVSIFFILVHGEIAIRRSIPNKNCHVGIDWQFASSTDLAAAKLAISLSVGLELLI